MIMKKAKKKNVQLAISCLIETLTILAEKEITDVDVTLNFIKKEDLQGLKNYLEAIRLKGGKGDE